MATGSLMVRAVGGEESGSAASAAAPCELAASGAGASTRPSTAHTAPTTTSTLIAAANGTTPEQRRHSMSFRSRASSSSDEDVDDNDDLLEPDTATPRKFSMDQHRPRSMRKLHRFQRQPPPADSAMSPGARLPTTSSSLNPEFLAPSPLNKKAQLSRPNSPAPPQRPIAVASRHRLATIRRESDCGQDNEVAHEKLVKTTQQVSTGFEDFSIDDKTLEERKRAKSLAEPISVFTNAFLPQSSSPSPTRSAMEAQKQCYSPSTQQVVRANISYSPSPSPTPASPTRSRIMRSMSPIAVRQISKRRYTATGSISGMESDTDSQVGGSMSAKRSCFIGAASPLVRDSLSAHSVTDTMSEYRSSSPLSVCSNSSFTPVVRPRVASNHQNSVDSDDNGPLDETLHDQYYLGAPLDTCSTTMSSRTETPVDEQMLTEDSDPASNNNQPGPSLTPAKP